MCTHLHPRSVLAAMRIVTEPHAGERAESPDNTASAKTTREKPLLFFSLVGLLGVEPRTARF
jgi:hypothetical protein